jgi:hypothetical protein
MFATELVHFLLMAVEETGYLKNTPISGATDAAPGKELMPRVESVSLRVLWCWKTVEFLKPFFT